MGYNLYPGLDDSAGWKKEKNSGDRHAGIAPEGFSESQRVARRGGSVAGVARRALESETGQSVITPESARPIGEIVAGLLSEPTDDEPK